MQFWSVDETTKLAELSALVGSRNVDQVLHYNEIDRTPNIGKDFIDACNSVIQTSTDTITWQRKQTILSGFASDSDVFEAAALSGESAWKLLSIKNTFPGYIKLPETIKVPDSIRIMGNGMGVGAATFKNAMIALETPPHYISTNVFNEYSSMRTAKLISADYTK